MDRRTFSKITLGTLGATLLPVPFSNKSHAITPFIRGRIAWTSDGNYHDKDDWGSYAMMTLLLKKAGVGISYADINNHFPQTNNSQQNSWEKQMVTSAKGLSYSYIDCRPDGIAANIQMNNAVNALRHQIQQSSLSNPLTICLAGPPDVIWHALLGVPNSVRQYVTILSHTSNYNEFTGGTKTINQCTGCQIKRIPNQNQRLNTKQNWGPWSWLNNKNKPDNQWVYGRMRASGRADVSDSGMMYYVLYGNPTPTVANYKSLLA